MIPVMPCFLNNRGKVLKYRHYDTITGAETHHLLSPKLREHSDQCVSAQRGSRAAAAAADPHQGERGVYIHA